MSRMRRIIDGYDIQAQIVQEKKTHEGGFLIVEGADDNDVFECFIDKEECSIVIAYTKENALDAAERLDSDGCGQFVCVVDADFDNINEKTYDSENIIVTEYHDLDILILCSSALEKFLEERAEPEKLEAVTKSKGTDVRSIVLEAASGLGYLRLLAKFLWEREDYDLDFKDLEFGFISLDTLSCDEEEMVGEVLANSNHGQVRKSELVARLKRIRNSQSYDLRQLCNGHDVMAILGISLRRMLGAFRDTETHRRYIEIDIRSAFDDRAFVSTQLFANLGRWEESHKPCRILRTMQIVS